MKLLIKLQFSVWSVSRNSLFILSPTIISELITAHTRAQSQVQYFCTGKLPATLSDCTCTRLQVVLLSEYAQIFPIEKDTVAGEELSRCSRVIINCTTRLELSSSGNLLLAIPPNYLIFTIAHNHFSLSEIRIYYFSINQELGMEIIKDRCRYSMQRVLHCSTVSRRLTDSV